MPAIHTTHVVPRDVSEFTEWATEQGWGDGLPLVPPTPERVAEFVAASGEQAETVIARIPPLGGECSVERLATNAVMAGAQAGSMHLLIAAVKAIAVRDFELHGMNVTTAPAMPAFIVNGPARHELGISFGSGCLGGANGTNAALGRAIRLTIRNVGGQRIGVSSMAVFGQPGRTAGILFGEWEEQSPWPPLGERRGVPGNAITAFAAMGTMNVLDNESERADLLLDRIGRSLAFPGSNGYRPHAPYVTVVVGINPIWAAEIAEEYADVRAVQERLWDIAALPLSAWPREHQNPIQAANMVSEDGRVHLVRDPDRVIVVVCGGRAGLHAVALHGNGACVPNTQPF